MANELLDKAIDKLREDLAWASPSGKQMGHAVIQRAYAVELLRYVEETRAKENPSE